MTAFSPNDHSISGDDAGSPTYRKSEEPARPADVVPVDDADNDPNRIYDHLPDDAWHTPLDQYDPQQASTSTAQGQEASSTAPPHTQEEGNRMPV